MRPTVQGKNVPPFWTTALYVRAYDGGIPIGTMMYAGQLNENPTGWLPMDGETLHAIKDYRDLCRCLMPLHWIGQRVFETYDETHFVLAGFNRNYQTWDVPGA